MKTLIIGLALCALVGCNSSFRPPECAPEAIIGDVHIPFYGFNSVTDSCSYESGTNSANIFLKAK